MTTRDRVLTELRKGDRSLGALQDASQCTYPELMGVLKALSSEGAIAFYFDPETSPPTLTYRLNRKPVPVVGWLSRR